jgi:hypothetical protein
MDMGIFEGPEIEGARVEVFIFGVVFGSSSWVWIILHCESGFGVRQISRDGIDVANWSLLIGGLGGWTTEIGLLVLARSMDPGWNNFQVEDLRI